MYNSKQSYLRTALFLALSLPSFLAATLANANPEVLKEQTLDAPSTVKEQNTAAEKTLSRPISLPLEETQPNTAGKPVDTKREQYEDWVLNCDGNNCIVHQYILDDKKRVISSVSLHKKQDNILVTFTVPLMTRIDRGVDIDVIRYDDASLYRKNLSFSYCTQIGCMMTYPLDQKIINAMEEGRKLSLTFAALDGRTVKSTHSLFGFSKVLAKFRDQNQ